MDQPVSNSGPFHRACSWAAAITVLAASILFGLTVSRLLFESTFPSLLWSGAPLFVIPFALFNGLVGLGIWRWLSGIFTNPQGKTSSNIDQNDPSSQITYGLLCDSSITAAIPFTPLFLNLFFLFDTLSSPLQTRFLFLASIWISTLLIVRLFVQSQWRPWLGGVMVIIFLAPIYLLTMGRTVGAADTFEFQVVVPQLGIAHPTGYPLYLLLSKPFTWLPLNEIAWRVNLGTMVFGLAAIILSYVLLWRLTRLLIPAVVAATVFGLAPTFWSQAIEAEVYSLNAVIVAAALLLMLEIGGWRVPGAAENKSLGASGNRSFALSILLAFILGLGLTNHLTIVILLPASVLTILFVYRRGSYQGAKYGTGRMLSLMLLAFILPLVLYAYLPIRWTAVNGEAMGYQRFIDWIIGGRFQGALQLTAWFQDGERYSILGRLIVDEWPWIWFLPLALGGLIWLFFHQWQYTVILLVTWIGYIFYALNYHVPDLAVFIIPAFMILAIWWALGISALGLAIKKLPVFREKQSTTESGWRPFNLLLATILLLIILLPFLFNTAEKSWSEVDASLDDEHMQWAQAVLVLPLETGATILADSAKFPPLYYLQQVENQRSDLDILLLPDEIAYRTELDQRLAEGNTLYLARFLPGLEGLYHLRSAGPLTEVSQSMLSDLPEGVTPADLAFGQIQLIGYQIDSSSSYIPGELAATFYWRTMEPLDEVLHIYSRLAGPSFQGPVHGQHPANNYYPTVAWSPGEVVVDFHSLPIPLAGQSQDLSLQVAIAPPFTDPDQLNWQTVAQTSLDPVESLPKLNQQFIQLESINIDNASFPQDVQPGSDISVLLSGTSSGTEEPILYLRSIDSSTAQVESLIPVSSEQSFVDDKSFLSAYTLNANLLSGSYEVGVSDPSGNARCGWMARPSNGCILGSVTIGGVSVPNGAVNFADKIALLSAEIDESGLQPGGIVDLNLTWQALAPVDENYTVFIQVLDDQDQIFGQVDSWPVQGTYPTSSWEPGEIVIDRYSIQLESELPPGQYKIHLGFYLLESLERLPVLDQSSAAIDDKYEIRGLAVD